VSPGEQNFHLQVQERRAGLRRAKPPGWADFGPTGFDPDEYCFVDSALNVDDLYVDDLHEVVPGKLTAMPGPREVQGGGRWLDVSDGSGRVTHRVFGLGLGLGLGLGCAR
jgi:hypothetical protein